MKLKWQKWNITKDTTPKYCHMRRLSSHILLHCTVTSRTELIYVVGNLPEMFVQNCAKKFVQKYIFRNLLVQYFFLNCKPLQHLFKYFLGPPQQDLWYQMKSVKTDSLYSSAFQLTSIMILLFSLNLRHWFTCSKSFLGRFFFEMLKVIFYTYSAKHR